MWTAITMATDARSLARKAISRCFGVGLLLLPIALAVMPVSTLDHTPTLCLWRIATGHECYGCGITHAVVSVLHGNFVEAWQYNRGIVIVMPVLIYLWAKAIISFRLYKRLKGLRLRPQ